MSPQDATNEYTPLDELIQKHATIFGQDITRAQLEQIRGLEIDEQGNIVKYNGNTQDLEKQLLETWTTLSPFLAKKIAETTIKH